MTEQELREKLTPAQWRIMREGGTEEAFVGRYWDFDENGVYACAACEHILFASLNKVDAKTGFPTFTKPFAEKCLEEIPSSPGKTAILCANCKSHIGSKESDQEFQANSVALIFQSVTIELPEEEEEKRRDAAETSSATPQTSPTVVKTSVIYVVASAAVGLALGAGGAYALCQNSCLAPNAAPTAATSTSVAATSTPAPATSPQSAVPTQTPTAASPAQTPPTTPTTGTSTGSSAPQTPTDVSGTGTTPTEVKPAEVPPADGSAGSATP